MLIKRARVLASSASFERYSVDRRINSLLDSNAYISNRARRLRKVDPRGPSEKLWLVLPFHPCWDLRLRKRLAKFIVDNNTLLNVVFNKNCTVRLSWKNALMPNAVIFQR